MSPLRFIVLGLVLIVADVPVNGLDLLVDPAGWAFILLGLQQLLARHPALVVPRNAAVVGLIVSIPMVVVSLGSLPDLVVETVLQIVIFFTLCTALARTVDQPEARAVFRPARWFDLGLNLLFVATLLARLPGLASVLALADLGVLAWATYWMWQISRSPELQAR